jgi:mitochondrial fission protein ELM1
MKSSRSNGSEPPGARAPAPLPLQRRGGQFAERLSIWTVSDGRAGIENQALGLAEAIARRTPARITVKRVSLRTPWRWAPPGLIPAPRQAMSVGADLLEPPWPDVWIGCGRMSLAFSMGVRTWSRGQTFVVQVQDPRVNPREFDLVIPPYHDDLEGSNVLAILGSPHRVTPERIAEEAGNFPRILPALPGPRFAVLIGGKSRRQDISAARARTIATQVKALQARHGGSLLVTVSRRTSRTARRILKGDLAPAAAVYFEGEGPNPYFAMLAAADAIFVTTDTVTMAAEAAATGKPVYLLAVDGDAGRIGAFHDALVARGCARWFEGEYEPWLYEPLRETDRAATAILDILAHRAQRV